MSFSKSELLEMSKAVPMWWHSIDLGQGVVTDGAQSPDVLARRVQSLDLPDLHGKHVLDIGAYDGFYSFEAERRARREWSRSITTCGRSICPNTSSTGRPARTKARSPDPYHETPHWRPERIAGQGSASTTAHKALSSKVEAIVGDFLKVDVRQIGTFDVVFFLGVLYHMENPLEAMKRVAEFTKQLAIIETAAVNFPGYEHSSLCEFYESNELNNDVSNWVGAERTGTRGALQGRRDSPASRS